jgi:hypothetical protein
MNDNPKAVRDVSELERAFEQIRRELREGARHGFFKMTVACEITTGHKRRIVVEAGKSFVFTVSAADVE